MTKLKLKLINKGGKSKDRANIFVGAAGTVKAIITLCKIKKIKICRNGIREGLLLSELFNKKPIENILDFSISNILINNNININHSKHVYKLTNLLFSSLKPVHKITENLDKDLSGAIENLNCTINDDTVIIKTYSKHSCEFLIREAQTSSELFKNIFNKSLYIV